MQPRNMTLEERERWAYANGDALEAQVLGAAIDALEDAREEGREEEREAATAAYEAGYADGHADGLHEAPEAQG